MFFVFFKQHQINMNKITDKHSVRNVAHTYHVYSQNVKANIAIQMAV